ncbi:hypothetical protein Ahy_A06g028818 isoform A [Arachis hypogaea]|uniref:Uncharacterized protein n=1 Tax=Arachis hypogaea TaxID=3818 RepID=A0A445CRT0_ARAHY|nr:hypothetical protein Ahy_A06g028818 isoform A [Arachis hypogaea]
MLKHFKISKLVLKPQNTLTTTYHAPTLYSLTCQYPPTHSSESLIFSQSLLCQVSNAITAVHSFLQHHSHLFTAAAAMSSLSTVARRRGKFWKQRVSSARNGRGDVFIPAAANHGERWWRRLRHEEEEAAIGGMRREASGNLLVSVL